MDKKTYMSSVSEAKIVADLTVQDYDIFTQSSGKSPFDLIAHKDGKILRVQVKSCGRKDSRGRFNVQLKSVRHNKTENKIIKFDPNSCDLLAIYLFEVDKICYLDPKNLKSLNEIRIDPTADYSLTKLTI